MTDADLDALTWLYDSGFSMDAMYVRRDAKRAGWNPAVDIVLCLPVDFPEDLVPPTRLYGMPVTSERTP